MSIDRRNVRGLVRSTAYDVRGARLGRVAQVFLDDRSDEPAWVAVDVTRTRGMRLLPLAGAALKGRHLVIRAERTTVRSAPRIDLGDGQLSSQDEARLLEHYGLAPATWDTPPDTGEHRPASPWPDDTERETAWEQPAQRGYDSHDTQAMPPAWDQPTGAPAAGYQPVANQPTHRAPADRPKPADASDSASETPAPKGPAQATDPPSTSPSTAPRTDAESPGPASASPTR